MKLYLYAAAALALLAALAYGAHIYKKAGRVDAAEHALQVERKAHADDLAAAAHNLKIAQEASNAYQTDLRRLESERSDVPVVRLCKSKPAAVSAESRTASGSDAATAGHVGEAATEDPGPDIGAELLDYGIACEANALQLERLQGWVRARE